MEEFQVWEGCSVGSCGVGESQIVLGGELVQVGIFIKQGVGIWSK